MLSRYGTTNAEIVKINVMAQRSGRSEDREYALGPHEQQPSVNALSTNTSCRVRQRRMKHGDA